MLSSKLRLSAEILMDYLLGAEIFAFDICLENRTNFEEFFFDLLHISVDVDFSTILSFMCMNQGGSS